ncbi:hypothetical protein [Nocardioides marmoribigeumensis]|uniref:Uncharacterized protein n=1 Tax=Nocardioides marmoribigeumensis TaxID=433649 RepID=A0ABU2BQ39_9ACTN|nr:hypothetical protein [Nocardioides marmoribigeumensis]MDR7360751.1 hypothetical protein [Nocardioides marmoribigeumensis]
MRYDADGLVGVGVERPGVKVLVHATAGSLAWVLNTPLAHRPHQFALASSVPIELTDPPVIAQTEVRSL